MSEQPLIQGETETSRTIIVRLSPGAHKLLRVRVAEQDTSIQKWVEALIHRELGIHTSSEKPKVQS
jgi:predicted HicB family RNase H-like nuclease